MTRRIGYLPTILLALVAVAAPAAEQPEGENLAVRVGFDGHYKVGVWTAVEVFLPNSVKGPGTATLTVPDGDGVPSSVSVAFGAGDRSVEAYVRFGRVKGTLTVRVEGSSTVESKFVAGETSDDGLAAAIGANRKIVVVLGADVEPIEAALFHPGQAEDQRPVVVSMPGAEHLPRRWLGYEGIDTVFIATDDVDVFKNLKPDGPRIKALNEWIRMGGRLVLSVGAEAEKAIGAGGPLSAFAPGTFEGMTVLHETGALEVFCSSETAVPARGRLDIPVPRLANVEGTIVAKQLDQPLVVRTARQFGRIVFLAVDIDGSPLNEWGERPLLVAELLDTADELGEEESEGTAMMHFGYTNMAGQLRGALDSFAGVRLVPFWAVVGLIVGYIILIGAGDYFFLGKVVRRMHFTWITFPAVAVGVCAAAYWFAADLKGDKIRVNQVNLVDVDAATRRARGTCWMNVFSPEARRYDLSVKTFSTTGEEQQNAKVLLSWLGLPGDALGGMNPNMADPVLWDQPYNFSEDLSRMDAMPIDVRSSKSLTARWSAAGFESPEADLFDDDGTLGGTLINAFDFPLNNCLLVQGRWVYELGDLKPGQSVQFGPTVGRTELKTLLTGTRLIQKDEKAGFRQYATPYDQTSHDLAYILRLMMFYEAAGGSKYTGLSNGYQQFVDFSYLLKTDRAILVATSPVDKPAAKLLGDGKPMAAEDDKQLTVYRFIFPVKPAEAD